MRASERLGNQTQGQLELGTAAQNSHQGHSFDSLSSKWHVLLNSLVLSLWQKAPWCTRALHRKTCAYGESHKIPSTNRERQKAGKTRADEVYSLLN